MAFDAQATHWAQETHIGNDNSEDIVMRDAGGSNETTSNEGTRQPTDIPNVPSNDIIMTDIERAIDTTPEKRLQQLRFESESKQIILKGLGSGEFATVSATICESTANEYAIEYQNDHRDATKQKAVIDKMRPRIYAAKILQDHRVTRPSTVQEFRNEVNVLRRLQYVDDDVLRGVTYILDDPRFGPNDRNWYLMPLLSGGSLDNLLHTFPKDRASGHPWTVPASLLWHMIAQIAEALLFLHFGIVSGERDRDWRSITHGDIHEGNLMLRYPGELGNYPDLVLTDFAFSQAAPDDMNFREPWVAFHGYQIRDLDHLEMTLYPFIDMTDADRPALVGALTKIRDISISPFNKDLREFERDLVKRAKLRRDDQYKILPEPWVKYLSQPTFSDEELATVLEQFEAS